ncbi:hypothetical protein DPMN_096152 [Dreissena polymorpha]|uniref:Uncharacterized protein n=1 Tax=Dreissena polymorpha TaxID=45954 RepID=A0A9D4R3E4_DREPO|nr:hypothetical protein DPMN_096152 [Dreissena polymorpha]
MCRKQMPRVASRKMAVSRKTMIFKKRGLNPYGLTMHDIMQFLLTWTSISQKLNVKEFDFMPDTGVALLLQSQALLTYNASSNIQLMKGKRYKWRRQQLFQPPSPSLLC